jgi:hypothetical protein
MDTPQESNLVKAYQEAYRLACARLSRCRPEEVCQNSKAFYDETTQTFVITYFNVTCRVSRDGGTVRLSDAPGEPTVTEKTLILHYLTQAQPRPLSGRGISFREVPGGGAIYYPAFQKRALDPLVKQFAERIPAFRKAAAALGVGRRDMGRPVRRCMLCHWSRSRTCCGRATRSCRPRALSYLMRQSPLFCRRKILC